MINIIFRRSSPIIISRKEYTGWREIQDIYDDYAASLEFESTETAREWLITEYPGEENDLNAKMDKFENSGDLLMEL
jgi:hypothetical protein